jgi:hypothetical protein
MSTSKAKATFKSVLEEVVVIGEEAFKIGEEAANIAMPIVDLLFPGVAPLFNICAVAAAKVETTWQLEAKKSPTGTVTTVKGQTKIQALVAAFTPAINAYAASQGLPPYSQTVITAVAQAAVDFLSAIPAATSSAASTSTK